MKFITIKLIFKLFILYFFLYSYSFADNQGIYEILKQLQKDVKTLEKAVYSESSALKDENIDNSNFIVETNSEDVLTRHLLKLSEIENQFQKLTNKFEEINFKLDKLSNRLSKVQADNQLRFQSIENISLTEEGNTKISKKTDEINNNDKILPGSSQPQDLGSISYKDTSTKEVAQKTQSIETTATIVTEKFETEENILPKVSPDKQYEFATSFLKVGQILNIKWQVAHNIGMQKLLE